MKKIFATTAVLAVLAVATAFGEERNIPGPSPAELVLLFVVAVLIVVGIALYLSRDILLRKKTDYDGARVASQRDRDYEKYHSDWGDESLADEEEDLPDDTPDYYKILGVARGATPAEIKERYRELAKKTHPDRAGGASDDAMAEINQAYEVLSDDKRRARYDKLSGSV